MVSALQALDAECFVDLKDFKIKCTSYCDRSGGSLKYCARLFRTLKPGVFAVECQRRVGDAILFAALYRRFQDELERALAEPSTATRAMAYGYHPGAGGASAELDAANTQLAEAADALAGLSLALRPFELPVELPALDVEAEGAQCQSDMIDSLLQMAASQHADVQLQGTLALVDQAAQLCGRDESARSLVHGGVLSHFRSLLSVSGASPHVEEVQRCAVTGIAHMVRSTFVAATLGQDRHFLGELLALGQSSKSSKRLVREVARVVVTLSENVREHALVTPEFEQALRDMYRCVEHDHKARDMLSKAARLSLVSI